MKRKLSYLLLIIILTMLIISSYPLLKKQIEKGPRKRSGTGDQAVWISYLEFNAYTKSVSRNDAESFSAFFQHILDRCRDMGINRVIVQVRPFGDALYESDYYPWSFSISEKQGQSPGYDPLEIMTDLTHKEHMKIEAWINPFRISSGDSISLLSEDNPARRWYYRNPDTRKVLEYEGDLYYNPSSKEVRKLILNGIEEIVKNYDVDGIHMDDYFYPEFSDKDYDKAFDAADYQKRRKNGKISQNTSLADWRRQNISKLVAAAYKTIKETDPTVTLGISPAGNPDLFESDLAYYADVKTWIRKGGYIDYIMPQIYWGYRHPVKPFAPTFEEWKQVTAGSDVRLLVGLAAYVIGAPMNLSEDEEVNNEWVNNDDMMARQMETVFSGGGNGVVFFSYSSFFAPDEGTEEIVENEIIHIKNYLESRG